MATAKKRTWMDAKGRERAAWRVRWRFGGSADGEWQSVTLPSKKQADDLKRKVEERRHRVHAKDPDVLDLSIIAGDHRRPKRAGEGPTFSEALDTYLAERTDARESSHEAWRVQSKHLLREWGDMSVLDITEDDAKALWRHLRKQGDGRAPMLLATAVMALAVKQGLLKANPCKVVKVPDPEPKGQHLTAPEVGLLIASAPVDGDRLILRLAYEAGLRCGEICALQPADIVIRKTVDGQRAWVKVERTATRVKGGWTFGDPKSRRGKRRIPIDVELAAALRAHGADKRRWLFLNARRAMFNPNTMNYRFRMVVRRANGAGLEGAVRLHDLRHSFATDLLVAGEPIHKVSRLLGHSDIRVTIHTYGNVTPDDDDETLKRLRSRREPARHLRAVQ